MSAIDDAIPLEKDAQVEFDQVQKELQDWCVKKLKEGANGASLGVALLRCSATCALRARDMTDVIFAKMALLTFDKVRSGVSS